MDLKNALKDVQLRSMNAVHRSVLAVSGNRIGNTLGSMPVYKVTTTGRVSGRPRTVLLTVPVEHDGSLVFVASKAGDDRDPDWYRNLVADPAFTAELVGSGEQVSLIARTASAEERAALWPQIVEAYRGYDGYQSSTEREIPVVIAEAANA